MLNLQLRPQTTFFIDFATFSQFAQLLQPRKKHQLRSGDAGFRGCQNDRSRQYQYAIIISWNVSTNLLSEQFHIVSRRHCWRVVHHLSGMYGTRGFPLRMSPALTIPPSRASSVKEVTLYTSELHTVVFRRLRWLHERDAE